MIPVSIGNGGDTPHQPVITGHVDLFISADVLKSDLTYGALERSIYCGVNISIISLGKIDEIILFHQPNMVLASEMRCSVLRYGLRALLF